MKLTKNRYLQIGLLVLALLAFGLFIGRNQNGLPKRSKSSVPNRPANTNSNTMPPVRPSVFENTALDVKFVGSKTCVECHREEHASYLSTAHSRALGDLELADEPDQVQFDHTLSQRRFRVQKRDNQLWHQEFYVHEGQEQLIAEHVVRYVIGSGEHTRSYLVEEDGFLLESPITWYANGNKWGVSPGFDVPHAIGFQRVAEVGCITCHAGRVEKAENTKFKVHLIEKTIGCESCHGPGALHVERHQSAKGTWEGEDFTIVHPDKLDRERAESICAQCHLRGDASVVLRNRDLSNFRPGLLLPDFRMDYALDTSQEQMTVVGHVGQMRLSNCYQSSEMTCTTCHDPHDRPTKEDRVESFKAKCAECHTDCGLEHDTRIARQSDNSCIACHMPRGNSDIPHLAITQHRIGIYDKDTVGEEKNPPLAGTLLPLYENSHLPKLERDRTLGLAYLELSERQKSDSLYRQYRFRASSLLKAVARGGVKDGDAESARARLAWEKNDYSTAIRLANNALDYNASSGDTANALFILGDAHLKIGVYDHALESFVALTNIRRRPDDWFLMGLCYREMGRVDQAIASMQTALRIDPTRNDIQEILSSLLPASIKKYPDSKAPKN